MRLGVTNSDQIDQIKDKFKSLDKKSIGLLSISDLQSIGLLVNDENSVNRKSEAFNIISEGHAQDDTNESESEWEQTPLITETKGNISRNYA